MCIRDRYHTGRLSLYRSVCLCVSVPSLVRDARYHTRRLPLYHSVCLCVCAITCEGCKVPHWPSVSLACLLCSLSLSLLPPSPSPCAVCAVWWQCPRGALVCSAHSGATITQWRQWRHHHTVAPPCDTVAPPSHSSATITQWRHHVAALYDCLTRTEVSHVRLIV